MIGLVLVVLVGAFALVMTIGSDSDDDDGDRTEAAQRDDSDDGDDGDPPEPPNTDDPEDEGNGEGGSVPPATEQPPDPTTRPTAAPTTAPPRAPAQVAVGECVEMSGSGRLLGKGACDPAGPPYRVTAVVDSPDGCPSPNAGAAPSGDYVLCFELNLVETYCYIIPSGGDGGWSGWIRPAPTCKAPDTVHIIDIVPGASNGDACTRALEWNRWYGMPAPQGVMCVMEY